MRLLSFESLAHIDAICDRFEAAQKAHAADAPTIEAALEEAKDEGERRALFVELLALEIAYKRKRGEAADPGDYTARFPADKNVVRAILKDAAKASVLAPGTRIDRYAIAELLGRGGMGEVYRAHDLELGRDVAVKVLRGPLAKDPLAVHRFEQEARTLASMSHANILAVYDFGIARGLRFFVMELLEGETLAARIARGPLTATEATGIAADLAAGLASAHRKGIVHRDLKPENVFLPGAGGIKILDFGLALAEGTEASEEKGRLVGSPAYMAPEQRRGEAAGPKSDVYALGRIILEIGAGAAIAERCMALRPEERPTAAEVQALLRA